MYSLLVVKEEEIKKYFEKKGIKHFNQHKVEVFILNRKDIDTLKLIIKNHSYLLDTL